MHSPASHLDPDACWEHDQVQHAQISFPVPWHLVLLHMTLQESITSTVANRHFASSWSTQALLLMGEEGQRRRKTGVLKRALSLPIGHRPAYIPCHCANPVLCSGTRHSTRRRRIVTSGTLIHGISGPLLGILPQTGRWNARSEVSTGAGRARRKHFLYRLSSRDSSYNAFECDRMIPAGHGGHPTGKRRTAGRSCGQFLGVWEAKTRGRGLFV